jgi:hypothetical protein
MLDRILITPDNRLLAFSTHDLSLYGGQTSPEFRVGEAEHAFSAQPSADTPSTDSQGIAPQHGAYPAPEIVADAPVIAGIPAAPAADAIARPLIALQTVDLSGPLVPAPTESAMVPVPTHIAGGPWPSPQAPDAEGASGAVAAGTVPGLVTTHAVQLPVLVNSLVETTGEVAGSVVGSATSTLAPTVDAVTSALAATGDLAGATVATAAEVVAPVTATAAQLVDTVTDTAEAVATAPLDAASAGPLAGTVLPLVEDDLSGLDGADPPAGVATLVSLISISDVFDVSDGPAAEQVAPIDAPGLLDTLAADVPIEDALLGAGDHDGSVLGEQPHSDAFGVI